MRRSIITTDHERTEVLALRVEKLEALVGFGRHRYGSLGSELCMKQLVGISFKQGTEVLEKLCDHVGDSPSVDSRMASAGLP
jgi:hypothetical protein